MTENKTIGYRLQNIPITVFFLLILAAMSYVTANPIGLPIPITEYTKSSYAVIEQLQPGDIVIVDTCWGPGGEPYFETGFIAIFKHIISKEAKVVAMSTTADGTMMFEKMLLKVEPEKNYGYEYGIDYVHLGYIPGFEPTYASLLEDATNVVSVDSRGTPLTELEIMDDLGSPTYQKIDLIMAISGDGSIIEGWIRQGSVRYGITGISYCYEVIFPQIVPFYPVSTAGIINGGTGAAEYEVLSGYPGDAAKLSDLQSAANTVILIFLLLGVVGYLIDPNKGGKS